MALTVAFELSPGPANLFPHFSHTALTVLLASGVTNWLVLQCGHSISICFGIMCSLGELYAGDRELSGLRIVRAAAWAGRSPNFT
jgi:hypothetical protein